MPDYYRGEPQWYSDFNVTRTFLETLDDVFTINGSSTKGLDINDRGKGCPIILPPEERKITILFSGT